MAASSWEQKKKQALKLLHKLLDIWQGREHLNKIEEIGYNTNNAVLALEIETDLPLPYQESEMSPGAFVGLVDILEAKDRSGGPEDEISKNLNTWIQSVEIAEYKPPSEENKTVIIVEVPPRMEDEPKRQRKPTKIRVAEQLKDTSDKIPPGQKSVPLSLTRMAQYWGGDMTPRKLKAIIKAGSIQVEQINRQTFVFDIEKLPAHVQAKVTK